MDSGDIVARTYPTEGGQGATVVTKGFVALSLPAMSDRDEIWGEGFTVDPSATVAELIRIESLPLGSNASKRAVVWWSDGSCGEALRWFDDEILFCEGDLLGKTEAELRSLKFRRDRSYLAG